MDMYKNKLMEGFKDESTPDMKYYAFDWDDNIVSMPTKIILKDDKGDEVGMSTEDFAEHRHEIGKKDFNYKGNLIVGYAENPFRNFRVEGDKQFLIDSMKAIPGPAFDDFRECINNGSIFAIITARGHNPKTIKEAIYNYIISEFNGIDKNQLIKNLRKFRSFTDEEDLTDLELIKSYLDLNKYHPVSFTSKIGAENPEQGKIMAMDEFVDYVREMSSILNKKAFLKRDLGDEFIPTKPQIGFSDDDIRNVEVIKKHYEDKPEKNIKTYSTSGGIKKKY